MTKKNKNGESGFTLVELVVVIAIIAVLAAVSVAGYFGFTTKANDAADISLVKQLDTLIKTADSDDLLSAVEMRRYFAANGVGEIKTKNNKNMIVYDRNKKTVEIVKSGSGSYRIADKKSRLSLDGALLANVFTLDGTALEINSHPVAPEEIFAGKFILSTAGNDFAAFIGGLREGNLDVSYLNKIKNEKNDTLCETLVTFISGSLFVGSDGTPTTYNLVYNENYENAPRTDFSTLKYAVFASDCQTISAQTFVDAASIRNLVLPSTLTSLAPEAFQPFVESGSIGSLTVAFMKSEGIDFLDEIKSGLTAKGATIAKAESLIEAIRNDDDVFISDIKRYLDVATADELSKKLKKAEAGDCLRLSADIEITQSLNIPAGVTVLIPCRDSDTGYDSTGYNPNGLKASAGRPTGSHISAYRTLTIAAGAVLTVNGTILINAVTGQPQAGHLDQDVNGGYGLVNLLGTIEVNANGLLDCCGYVRGAGKVVAHNNAEVRDLFVVRNWRGGSQAFAIYPSVYPMNEYDMHNIESTLELNSGASLVGTVKMFASGSYYYTRFPQVDNDNGLIRLKAGAKLIKTYDPTVSEAFQYGRETYRLAGGAIFSSSVLPIVGMELSTADFIYPIDGDIDFELTSGAYAFDSALSGKTGIKGYKFMPGSKLEVAADATLYIPKDVDVVFYDEFNDIANTSGTEYPERPAARLKLDAGSTVNVDGNIAGKIEIADISAEQTTVTLNGSTEIRTQEAKGYLSGLRTMSFAAYYSSADSVYLHGFLNGSYRPENWVTNSSAVAAFKSLTVLNKTAAQLTDATLIEEAKLAIDYYRRLIKANLSAADFSTVKAYETKIAQFEDAVYPAAAVGDVTYSSFSAALSAAGNGQTVRLLKDITNYDVITVAAQRNLVLDLNGHRFTAQAKINNQGTLIIRNGSVVFSGFYTEAISNYGNLTVSDCEVSTASASQIIKNYKHIELIENSLFKSEKNIITNDTNSDTTIALITGSSFSATKACLSFSGYSHTTDIGTVRDSSFTSSDENTLSFGTNVTVERMENCTVACNSTTTQSWIKRSAMSLSGNAEVKYFSGRMVANSNIGVVNSTSSKAIYFSNDIFLKNLDAANSAKLLVFTSYADQIRWETRAFAFEPGYILSTSPIESGEQQGYYTTVLGYSILYVDTQYDEETLKPLTFEDGSGNLYGHQFGISYYKLDERAAERTEFRASKDTVGRHYEFDCWTTADGKTIDFSRLKTNTIAYAKYKITDQTAQFLGAKVKSHSSETHQYSYGRAFDTFAEAAKYVDDYQTVILLKDYVGPGIEITENKTTYLNLGGHQMTFDGSTAYGFHLTSSGVKFYLDSDSGTLNIDGVGTKYLILNDKGGTFAASGTNILKLGLNVAADSYLIYSPTGAVELDRVHFENGPGRAVYIGSGGSLKIGGDISYVYENITFDIERGAEVVINKCTIRTDGSATFLNVIGEGTAPVQLTVYSVSYGHVSWYGETYFYAPTNDISLFCNDTATLGKLVLKATTDADNQPVYIIY